jgi:lipopolysaccharide/colanic/teichoic acid biosynthesis glycosyltransferase
MAVSSARTLAELDQRHATGEQVVEPAGGQVYLGVKRLVDILVAGMALLVLLPLMGVVAVLIKLTSRGPVFFAQQRAGLDGQPFTMYKFRTMRIGAEDDQAFLRHQSMQAGPVFKLREDPRLTWGGKFLRRSSIDELPQLINVLAGQMSLVGPRPLWVPEAQAAVGVARLRTAVKPGLTCLWQISGRSELTYEQWVLLDLYYIRNRGLMLDLLILIQTIPAVLSGHGAY